NGSPSHLFHWLATPIAEHRAARSGHDQSLSALKSGAGDLQKTRTHRGRQGWPQSGDSRRSRTYAPAPTAHHQTLCGTHESPTAPPAITPLLDFSCIGAVTAWGGTALPGTPGTTRRCCQSLAVGHSRIRGPRRSITHRYAYYRSL